jgi:hypothetical protein
MSTSTGRVVIGMDPHKRTVTIEMMTDDETILGGGRFGTDAAGYRSLVRYAKQWSERIWAIEGCQGIGKHVALRRPTRTPWPWSAPGCRGCGQSSTTSSSPCCGSWSTGDGPWVRTTPG